MLLDELRDPRMIFPRAVGVIFGQGPFSKAREAASTARSTSTLSHSGTAPKARPYRVEGLEGLARGGVGPPTIDIGLIAFELRRTIEHDGYSSLVLSCLLDLSVYAFAG